MDPKVLESLERELNATRMLARVLGVLILALGTWMLMDRGPSSHLELTDDSGRRLSLSPSGLRLFDDDGRPRATVELGADGPQVSLLDEHGRPRAWLALSANDAPQLALAGPDGLVRASLLSTPNGLFLLNGGPGGATTLIEARDASARLSLSNGRGGAVEAVSNAGVAVLSARARPGAGGLLEARTEGVTFTATKDGGQIRAALDSAGRPSVQLVGPAQPGAPAQVLFQQP
jgi:hypothetical protein